MSREFLLTDVDAGVHEETFETTCGDGRVTRTRLRGGVSDGVDVVTIDNGALRLAVLPTRGMGIWNGNYAGLPIGWDSPVRRPVHPAFVDQGRRGGIGWLDGFNELLCRCGLAWHGPPCDDGGQPLTVHGRIANTPAHRVVLRVDDESIRLEGTVDETSLFGPALRLTSELVTSIGSNGCEIVDTIENLGGQPAEVELLYHVNLGPPFLEAGSRFHAALAEVAPRDARAAEGIADWTTYGPPETGYAEQVYLTRLRTDEAGRSPVLLRNAAGDRGLSLDVETSTLPCFTLWKNTAARADGYVTGLEPSTSYPNTRPFERERGRVLVLQPGESRRFRFGFAVHADADSVAAVEARIDAIPGEAIVHETPQTEFSPTS